MITFFSCKTQKYTLSDYDGPILSFGKSGGFAGAITNFKLMENGQLFQSSNGIDFKEVCQIEKKVTKQMFKNYSTLNIGEVVMDDPGNMTYFVGLNDEAFEHKMVWGGSKGEASAIIKQYYTTLMKLSMSDNRK